MKHNYMRKLFESGIVHRKEELQFYLNDFQEGNWSNYSYEDPIDSFCITVKSAKNKGEIIWKTEQNQRRNTSI